MLISSLTGATGANEVNPGLEHQSPEPDSAFIDGTFIGKHILNDAALVLANGAITSSSIEILCLSFVPQQVRQPGYCAGLASEATVSLYLLRVNWPDNGLRAWQSMNMLFFAVTDACIYSHNGFLNSLRVGVVSVSYFQMMKLASETVGEYIASTYENVSTSHLNFYATQNGVSTGLIAGGLFLWQPFISTGQSKKWIGIGLAAGVTALSTRLQFLLFQIPEEFNNIDVAAVGALFGASAGIGAETEAIAGAVDGAIAGVTLGTRVGVGVGAAAGAAAGAVAGIAIVILTGRIIITISSFRPDNRIIANVLEIGVSGLPLLISSLVVSGKNYMTNSATTHETMRADNVGPVGDIVYCFSRIQNFMHSMSDWLWFNNSQLD